MRVVILPGTVMAVLAAGCSTGGNARQADLQNPGYFRPEYVNAVFTEAVVEVKPEVVRMPAVEYPDSLRLAGVQGRVMIQFIIDTMGRAEPASIQVVQSPHPGFDAPALRVVTEAEFKPGRVAGRPVRVLVLLPIDYKVRAPQ